MTIAPMSPERENHEGCILHRFEWNFLFSING